MPFVYGHAITPMGTICISLPKQFVYACCPSAIMSRDLCPNRTLESKNYTGFVVTIDMHHSDLREAA